ncbi:MaoC family dehydratase N-terminal domain-containing protein [Rhodococcus sp. KRD162]|uniref:FAS1-like dehydratase domain-containing protein n=1 Tax=Rhodococcus sp. KRD162 TaxID=2729725 RepID=UPI0019CF4E9E|nr:MaoC family dehydratase N-terminal domain-containing protein [Rhodococcus sp. KRD162]
MTTATHEDSTGASQPVHTSSNPAVGTYDEAVAHVGRRSPTYVADVPVGEGSVAMFCAMIEDANPIYWDRELAQQIFGGPVAPPALVQGTVLPLPWRPDGARSQNLAVFQVPLPGRTLINVSTDAVYHRPFFAGEVISYHDEVVDISPERTTRLGTGHFVTTVFRYVDAEGRPIADIENVMFRFGEADR